MAKTSITIRIDEEAVEFLQNNFSTPTAGAQQCVEIVRQMMSGSPTDIYSLTESINFLQYIRAYSKRELKGLFTANEWKYLADSLNGTIITPEFRCNQGGLIASIEDSNDFNNLGAKWEVNVPEFVEKVKQLTGAQIDSVYMQIEMFWKQNESGVDIDKWANGLN